MTMSDDWVSSNQAAQLAGVSPRTVQRWATQGLLTAQRDQRGRWQYHRGELIQIAADTSGVTPAEVANRMGVSTRTVRRMIDRGELDGQRTPGGQYRIDQGEDTDADHT